MPHLLFCQQQQLTGGFDGVLLDNVHTLQRVISRLKVLADCLRKNPSLGELNLPITLVGWSG